MTRLMIPGPVPLSPAVAAELAGPAEAHYGPAYVTVHRELIALLREVLGTTEAHVYPLVGSGSSGLDATLGSLVERDETIVVGVNGYFGQRLATIGRGLGARVVEVEGAWGEPLGVEAVEATLRSTPDAVALAVTHVETSTGVVNPVEALAALAHDRGVLIVVDAISSAGGMTVGMDALGIDVCVTASQKALGGPAGLAPVAVGARAHERIEHRRTPRGWVLDLRTWHEYATRQADWHPMPVTMPTNVVRALRQGLRELMAEGVAERAARLDALGARLRRGLREMGLRLLVEDRWAAPVVTAVRAPEGRTASSIVDGLEREHGIRIAGAGFGPLGDRVFRIGHMAPGTSERDIDDVLAALRLVLGRASSPGSTASGVARSLAS